MFKKERIPKRKTSKEMKVVKQVVKLKNIKRKQPTA